MPGSGGGTLLGGVRKEVRGGVWGRRVVWVAWVAVGGVVAVAGPGAEQVGESWRRAGLPGGEADKDGGDGCREEREAVDTVGYVGQLLCHGVHPFWRNERQVVFHRFHFHFRHKYQVVYSELAICAIYTTVYEGVIKYQIGEAPLATLPPLHISPLCP